MFIRNINMWNKKVSYLLLVFGIIVWLTTSFVYLSKCWSAQNDVQEINLSKQELKTLPCVWINGRTLLSTPPEPLNRLKIAMNLSPSKSIFQALQPNSFDPFYIDRIVSKDVLMNTMFPYKEEKSAPLHLFDNQIVDQFSEDEFLYYTRKAGASKEETYRSYFRVRPYQKQSKLIYSESDTENSKSKTYAGYLSNTNQYCFVSGERLLLYDPGKSKVMNEAYFPKLSSFFNTDGRSLFLFVDEEEKMNAYSIQKHALIWQNATIKKDWYTQYNFLIRPVSFSDQWILATDFSKQKFFSPKSGDLLASFDLKFVYTDFPESYQEVNNALWFQYYKKYENAEHIFDLKFEKIIYSKEKGISITLYQLDNPVFDPVEQIRLEELAPVSYSYLPNHNKVLIVFKDLLDQETQAIFELP
jgi:hypothetical protein